jgi:sugar phosphate isomerase/epimerase
MNPPWAEHFKVDEDVGKLKEELASLGLRVPMISYYAQPPVDRKLRIAKELGAHVAVTGGINLKRRPEKLAELREELELAYELDIKISYENHYGELETIEDMQYFLQALDYHPAATIALAPTHLSLFGQTPEDALHALKDRVTVCYLWDVDSSITPTEADLSKKDNWWENGMAQTPGGSDIDFHSYMQAANRYAPEAILNLNWHGTYHWDLPRIMASLIQARHVIDRSRHLNVDSVFNRHTK